ncbi:MAG: clostripain-related cysteine peptidase [Methanomicrobium sp.]|nr:clostripain-related cysteine peptidase [Methanomicrobium sp.]
MTDIIKTVYRFIPCIALLIVLLISAGCTDNQNTSEYPDIFSDYSQDQSTFIAIYMVGSDLESDSGARTFDLNSMLEGYSDADPDFFNVVAGFGGANQAYWKGINVESIESLKKDSYDGIFGNEEYYEYKDSSANMGDKETFEGFLDYISLNYPDYDNRYLILWNHGGGYDGVGYDENFDDDRLTLTEISEALSESKSSFDLIGFDACLMSMAEVAHVLKPYSEYLVASEETEPESGWMYDILFEKLSKNKRMSPDGFGKAAVDSFLKSEDKGKTLSLVNLEKTDEFIKTMDSLGFALNRELNADNFESIGQSYLNSQGFNYNPKEMDRTSVDVYSFSQNLKTNIPSLSMESDAVRTALSSFALYSGHDDYIETAKGISLCSPRYIDAEKYYSIAGSISLSENWDNFFENYILTKSSDYIRPEIKKSNDGYFEITDNLGVAEVYTVYFIENNDISIRIGEKIMNPDENARYSLPGWNGQWYYLENSRGKTANLNLEYLGPAKPGWEKYSSEISLTRDGITEPAYLTIILNPVSHEYDISVRPENDEDDSAGGISFQDSDKLLFGDIITAWSSVYDEDGDYSYDIEIGEIKFDDDTILKFDKINDYECTFGISAEDFNGNINYSDIYYVR